MGPWILRSCLLNWQIESATRLILDFVLQCHKHTSSSSPSLARHTVCGTLPCLYHTTNLTIWPHNTIWQDWVPTTCRWTQGSNTCHGDYSNSGGPLHAGDRLLGPKCYWKFGHSYLFSAWSPPPMACMFLSLFCDDFFGTQWEEEMWKKISTTVTISNEFRSPFCVAYFL